MSAFTQIPGRSYIEERGHTQLKNRRRGKEESSRFARAIGSANGKRKAVPLEEPLFLEHIATWAAGELPTT
ncbi:hypothetical protein ABEV40_12570, partial [Geobacillus thermocatenulatus]|uniref:hypothetical protein n=1 Tax=Geobacillus thermocatenulatus TaxID=33938 RepID=UPI003D19C5FB